MPGGPLRKIKVVLSMKRLILVIFVAMIIGNFSEQTLEAATVEIPLPLGDWWPGRQLEVQFDLGAAFQEIDDIYFNWSDTLLRHPFRVELFNGEGEQTMVAELAKYKTINTGEGPENSPKIATDIKITFPQNRSKIHIVLSEMTTDPDKGQAEVCRFRDIDTNELPARLRDQEVIYIDSAGQLGGPDR